MLIMTIWKISISMLEAPRNPILLDKYLRGQFGSEGKRGERGRASRDGRYSEDAERRN